MKKLLDKVTEINEYKDLKRKLLNSQEIKELVSKKQDMVQQLRNQSEESTIYLELKKEYELICDKLHSNEDYVKFKRLERDINLFIMDCNKKISTMFDLKKKR